MAAVALNVPQREFHFEDWHITFNLAAGIVEADIGKAVSVDTSGDMKVKLTVDLDVVYGRLETVENRVQEGLLVGTVAMKFIGRLPATGAIAVGASVQGSATPGVVKSLAAAGLARGVALSAAAGSPSYVNVALG